jgi:glycine cleavage system aminomethyltransferase T
VIREVNAVRNGVGVCDVSTLGKIDIQGADAAEFLNRVYINGWTSLAVGKARYGLMLREDGFVMDDGTTARLGDTHFVMTTTTANAGRVMQHLEFCHQALWPSLDVRMVSVTEQWAQYAIAGPNARDVLRGIRRFRIMTFPTRPFPIWRRVMSPSAVALRRACSGFRSRASLPMSWRCRRRMATRRYARSWRLDSPTASAPTAPKRWA